MMTEASLTGRTILTALQQLAAKIEPTRAEQKAQADYRRLTATQQVATIGHLAQQVKKQQEQGKSIACITRLLGLLVTNGTEDAQTERSSTPKHDRPTKRTGAGYTTSELPGKDATPATQDAGHRSSPLAQALIQLAERREAQKKTKEEAKRNRPWRNVPEYYAKKRERLKHRPAKASNDAVQAYRRRVIQQQ